MVECARCFQIQFSSSIPALTFSTHVEDHRGHKTGAAEQTWMVRSSENDSVFLCPLPPQRAVQGAKAAVLLLLLFSKLDENLEQTERM